MRSVLIGYGQIGKALFDVFKDYHEIWVVDQDEDHKPEPESGIEIMLVAIPYSKQFIENVKAYQKRFKPKATIIFSTVPIGTCSKLGAVHSPIEGRHPHLAESIRKTARWVGDGSFGALDFFKQANIDIRLVEKSEHTEFLKLASTTLYGLNIEFARYRKKICDDIGLDFEKVKQFDEDYNKLYRDLNLPQFQRYILDPPEGKIGGHCVLPNAEILYKQHPDIILSPLILQKRHENSKEKT